MACLGALPPGAFLASKRFFRSSFQTALFLFLLNVVAANAQNFAGLEQGIKPYGSYHGGDIDSISMVNGSLTLHLPLISYPQRGGKLQASFSLVYANPILQPTATCDPHSKVCTKSNYNVYYGQNPGPGLTYPYALNAVADFVPRIGASFLGAYYMATEPDGAVHQLSEIGSVAGTQYLSADATGYFYVPYSGFAEGVLTDRQGTRYDFTSGAASARFEDANGNLITTNSSQGAITGWTDTMGRGIPAPTNTTNDNSNLTKCPPSSPAATSATLWSPPGPNGGNSQYEFCWATIPISFTPPDCNSNHSGCQMTAATSTQMMGLVLPNSTAWTFAYDSWGELTKITFPTGGSISYGWTYIYGTCVAGQYIDPISGVNTGLWPYRRAVTTRMVNDETGAHQWTYFPNTTVELGFTLQTTVTDPLGNDAVHTETGLGSTCSLYETQVDKYAGSHTSGTKLQTTSTSYNYTSNSTINNVFGLVAINVVPKAVTTTDWPSGGQTSQVTKTFDAGAAPYNPAVVNILYGDLLTETESDFGNGSPGGLLRQTVNQYMALSGPNASYYLTNNLLSLPYTVQVDNGPGTKMSLTQYNYDENTPISAGLNSSYQWVAPPPPTGSYRGNNTSVLRWLNSGTFSCPNGNSGGSNGYLISKKTYLDDGMLNTSADPCGNTNTYTYNLTYWGALATTVTNALGQPTTNTYDFNTSLLATTTDPNSLTTTYCSSIFCYDSMWRITEVSHPDGGLDTITHQEVTPPFTATLTSTINSSQNKIKTNVFDQLGRISQTQLASDPQNPVLTNTTYDPLGRVATESNPYRSGTDATSSPGTTTYGYDALSRKITVAYQDNVSVLNTAYCGPSTLVTDPTGKWRRSRVNGLGQLVEVDEPNSLTATVASTGCPGTSEPIWVTSYTNDALGNLTQVVQNGTHTRIFSFDSLSRLLTAVNPENSSSTNPVTYTYNPDGPLLTKTDARSITTSYTYDALHRTLGVTYSNSDPPLAFTYDGTGCLGLSACQNIGYRTGMTDGAGSEAWSYEVDKPNLRSIHVQQRTNDSSPSNITKTTKSYLDLAGNVTQLVYPTGRTVNYNYDSADRPSNAADSSNGITYVADWKTPPANTTCIATAVCYTPQGSIYGMSTGQTSTFTGFNLLEDFSSRLQPLEIKASSTAGAAIDLTYNFVDPASEKNAGHVYGITNNLNSSRSQSFTYDQLNRVYTAETTATTGTFCWGYQFSYDTWANLNSQAGLTGYGSCTENSSSATADANNHLSGLSYDASGNTLSDGNYTYTWNAESEMKTAAGVTYIYDGDGRRAEKVGSKLYWYGSGGEILSETDASGNTLNDYVFFGGKRVALVPGSGSAVYYAEDFLGSSRVMVQSNGTLCYDGDFVPFGGERPYTSTCSENYKFEGKERDTETANDNFDAREYTWRFGRWLSSDWSATPVPVPYANLSNPQTLNLYAMVADDPESFADLDGHDPNPAQAASASSSANQCADPNGCSAPAQNQQSPQRGLTVGVGLAGNADVGVVKAGAEANATVVATASISSSGKPSVGVAASGAAVAYAGDHVAAAPKQETKPLVAGAYAGGGVTLVVANTANSKGLSGPFQTISGNVGGGQGASVALSFDHNGTFVFQVTLGPGLGVSGWAVTTNTKAGCAGGSACE